MWFMPYHCHRLKKLGIAKQDMLVSSSPLLFINMPKRLMSMTLLFWWWGRRIVKSSSEPSGLLYRAFDSQYCGTGEVPNLSLYIPMV